MFHPALKLPLTFTFDPFSTYTVEVNELPLDESYFVVSVVPVPCVLVTCLTTILALLADTTPPVAAFSAHT